MLAAIKGENTLAEPARQYDVHANQITTWESQFLDEAARVFDAEVRPDPDTPPIGLKALHAKIGELTLTDQQFIGRSAHEGQPSELKTPIDPAHDLAIMRRIDELHLN